MKTQHAHLVNRMQKMHTALVALNTFARPTNWNDPEDPEQQEAWTLLDAVMIAYKMAMENTALPYAAPDGYALVPVQPTEAMLSAGIVWGGEGLEYHEARGRISTAWAFMLNAAQSNLPEVKP